MREGHTEAELSTVKSSLRRGAGGGGLGLGLRLELRLKLRAAS